MLTISVVAFSFQPNQPSPHKARLLEGNHIKSIIDFIDVRYPMNEMKSLNSIGVVDSTKQVGEGALNGRKYQIFERILSRKYSVNADKCVHIVKHINTCQYNNCASSNPKNPHCPKHTCISEISIGSSTCASNSKPEDPKSPPAAEQPKPAPSPIVGKPLPAPGQGRCQIIAKLDSSINGEQSVSLLDEVMNYNVCKDKYSDSQSNKAILKQKTCMRKSAVGRGRTSIKYDYKFIYNSKELASSRDYVVCH